MVFSGRNWVACISGGWRIAVGRWPEGLALVGFFEDGGQFLDKVVDVLERAIDRGEPDEGDLIDSLEGLHDLLADVAGGDFAIKLGVDLALDVTHDPLDLIRADRALVTGLLDPRADLLAIKRNANSILFDDFKRRLLKLFVGRKPPATFQAFTSTANHELLTAAGIDNFRLSLLAEWTEHRENLLVPRDLSAGRMIDGSHQSVRDTEAIARLPDPQTQLTLTENAKSS